MGDRDQPHRNSQPYRNRVEIERVSDNRRSDVTTQSALTLNPSPNWGEGL
jgi:hypothetical protein